MTEYIIEYDQFRNKTLQELINEIHRIGIKLNDLKVKDLTYYNDEFIEHGHGVYVFRDPNRILIVGKATSTSFTERIPKHFDIRTGAWFNRLLFVTCLRKFEIEKTPENYRKSSRYVFDHSKLILINFKVFNNSDKIKIGKLESILRKTTDTLNQTKSRNPEALTKTLEELIDLN